MTPEQPLVTYMRVPHQSKVVQVVLTGSRASSRAARGLAAAADRATLTDGDAITTPWRRSILYRRIALAALFVVGAAQVAPAARDPARCRELNRKYETGQAQLTAVEVSLTLFAAANANCVNLATRLLDQSASVDARDRLGARALSHAARSGHLREELTPR